MRSHSQLEVAVGKTRWKEEVDVYHPAGKFLSKREVIGQRTLGKYTVGTV